MRVRVYAVTKSGVEKLVNIREIDEVGEAEGLSNEQMDALETELEIHGHSWVSSSLVLRTLQSV